MPAMFRQKTNHNSRTDFRREVVIPWSVPGGEFCIAIFMYVSEGRITDKIGQGREETNPGNGRVYKDINMR